MAIKINSKYNSANFFRVQGAGLKSGATVPVVMPMEAAGCRETMSRIVSCYSPHLALYSSAFSCTSQPGRLRHFLNLHPVVCMTITTGTVAPLFKPAPSNRDKFEFFQLRITLKSFVEAPLQEIPKKSILLNGIVFLYRLEKCQCLEK